MKIIHDKIKGSTSDTSLPRTLALTVGAKNVKDALWTEVFDGMNLFVFATNSKYHQTRIFL